MSDSVQPHELQHTPGFPVLHCLPEFKLMSTESVMPSHHLILCHPLLFLPSIFPSFRVFSIEFPLCIRWPKYWSFRFSISPYNEYSGLISFRIDWFDLAVSSTLKSLLWHHDSKASILWMVETDKKVIMLLGVLFTHPLYKYFIECLLHFRPAAEKLDIWKWTKWVSSLS